VPRDVDPALLEAVLARLDAAGKHYTPADLRVDSPTAAWILGIAPGTLRNWRDAGKGPQALHIGRVWYRITELLAWMEDQRSEDRAA